MSQRITIYTGPVNSGKTTRLKNWLETQEECGGILMPVLNGKKYLYSIESGETREIELHESEEDLLQVGRFTFSGNAFAWARKKIRAAVKQGKKLIVIDEIGPLELAGQGFEPEIRRLIKEVRKKTDLKLILVIRESLMNRVAEHYRLETGEYSQASFR